MDSLAAVSDHLASPESEPRAAAFSPGRTGVGLADHPHFTAAMRASAQSAVELYQGNRLLNALATDRARFILSVLCVYLHNTPEAGQPHAGLTLTRAKAACARLGLCSPGRTVAILALMQWGGYLAADTLPAADRRVRRLVPTRRLLELHQRRWQGQLTAAAMVMPQLQAVLHRIGDPGFGVAFAVAQSQTLLSGMRVLDTVPQLELFAERDCGLLILFSIFLEGGGRSSEIPVSTTALAHRFGVSRAHVDRLLCDAETSGLLRYRRQRGAAVCFEPELEEGLRRFFERVFEMNADCAAAAFADLDAMDDAAAMAG